MLESRLDDAERVWLKIRIPARPNGRTGWVREEQLSNLKPSRRTSTIDRGKLTATLRKNGKKIWRSRVGVGKRRHGHAGGPLLDPRAALATSAAARSTGRGRSARRPTRRR